MKFIDDFYEEEQDIIEFLNTSKPNYNSKLLFLKIEDKSGWVNLRVKLNETEFSINYSSCMFDTAYIIKFFVEIINLKEDIVLFLDNEGSYPLFYVSPIDDELIRLFIATDYDVYLKFCNDEIDDYNLNNYKIECDIVINKRILLSEFYDIIYPFTQNYNLKTAYFPVFNTRKGEKYLETIKEYLKQ